MIIKNINWDEEVTRILDCFTIFKWNLNEIEKFLSAILTFNTWRQIVLDPLLPPCQIPSVFLEMMFSGAKNYFLYESITYKNGVKSTI